MKYAEDMQSRDDNFDALMTRAIERGPDVTVPADFAARVAAKLPPLPARRKPMRVGRAVAAVSAVVLAGAMFAIAPHAVPSFASVAFDFELLAVMQLAGIGYWLAVRRGS
jgi:hypothetical protein